MLSYIISPLAAVSAFFCVVVKLGNLKVPPLAPPVIITPSGASNVIVLALVSTGAPDPELVKVVAFTVPAKLKMPLPVFVKDISPVSPVKETAPPAAAITTLPLVD